MNGLMMPRHMIRFDRRADFLAAPCIADPVLRVLRGWL